MSTQAAASVEHRRSEPIVWRFDITARLGIAVLVAMLIYSFRGALIDLADQWMRREEFSHGFLIPLVSAFLVWQRKDALEQLHGENRWSGFALCVAGLALLVIGELSAIYLLAQYALVIVIAGLVVASLGWRGLKLLWVPVFFLVFMIPLPPFLYNKLSQALQLLSSLLGVEVIQAFGISVFLEGNVIDLGSYKLQVAEACDGLRYLFPLTSFGFLCAYLFKAPLWQRALVFASSVPITVLMNSFRIGVIGVLVEHWGTGMAEGFLHDFQGWAVFMTCAAILLFEVWLFVRYTKPRRAFNDAFQIDFPRPTASNAIRRRRSATAALLACGVMLILTFVSVTTLHDRQTVVLPRKDFSRFPMQLNERQGRHLQVDAVVAERLNFTDYLLAQFESPRSEPVVLYVAYYQSQRAGGSSHSPSSCIPSGGWSIRNLSQRDLGITPSGQSALRVNRVEITRGDDRQLVYYWFVQRGRVLTNEFAVKAYLLWDALKINRTDGALVRLTTPLAPGEGWAEGDERLVQLTTSVESLLADYVPGG